MQSARELAQRQLAIEADEIRAVPQEEQQELALIYEAKGLPAAEARKVAAELMLDEGKALETLAQEELGIDPADLGAHPGRRRACRSGSLPLGPSGRCSPLHG